MSNVTTAALLHRAAPVTQVTTYQKSGHDLLSQMYWQNQQEAAKTVKFGRISS